MAASGTGTAGAGLSSLLHEKLTAGMGLASEIGLNAQLVRDRVSASAVQTVMGTGNGTSVSVHHSNELYARIARTVESDPDLDRKVFAFLPGYPNRNNRSYQEAKQAMSAFAFDMMKEGRRQSSEAIQEHCDNSEHALDKLVANRNKLADELKSLHEGIRHIAKDITPHDKHTAHRIQVKLKFDTDKAFIEHKRRQINAIETRISSSHTLKLGKEDVQSQYSHPDPVISAEIKECEMNLVRWERDIKRINTEIETHFTSGIHTTTVHTNNESVSLNAIPKNPSKDKGVSLIQVTIGYIKTHIKEYPDIIPYMERVADDMDVKSALHYEPPSISDGYSVIPEESRIKYRAQSLALYNQYTQVFKHDMHIIDATQSRFDVGKDPINDKDQRIAYPNDGVYLFFALVCQHKPASSSHSKKLTDIIYKADSFFEPSSNYANVATAIKQQIVQCNKAHIKLIWALSGKPILDKLLPDPIYSSMYDRYVTGGDTPEDCHVTLDKMLTEIIRRAKPTKRSKHDRPQAFDATMHEEDDYDQDQAYMMQAGYQDDYEHPGLPDDLIDMIYEADEDEDSDMKAMWMRQDHRGRGRGRGRGKGGDRFASRSPAGPRFPRLPSAGRDASRRFGSPFAGSRRAFQATGSDPVRPPKGSCHAKGCRRNDLKDDKTLCIACLGKGKREGKLAMYHGRDQLFKRRPEANMADQEEYEGYDEGYDDAPDVSDEMVQDYEAHMARASQSFVSRKRQQVSPGHRNVKQQKQQGYKSLLQQAFQAQMQDAEGQGAYTEHEM